MIKKIGVLLVTGIITFSLSGSCRGDELSELKEQLKAMQIKMQEQMKQIQEQQEQIEAMQKRIETLEDQAPRAAEAAEGPKYAVSRKLLDKFELGGTVEVRFLDIETDAATSEGDPHFEVDEVRLLPAIQITEDMRAEADLEFKEGGTILDEYYFIFSNLPFNSNVQIGKDDRFFKTKNYTERYPLAGNAFWRDEEIGILWQAKYEPFYAAFSWSNGLGLGLRQPGEDVSYRLIHDNTRTSSHRGVGEISAGLGFKQKLGNYGTMDVLGWGLYNRLSAADVSFLKTNLTNYTSDDEDQYRAGVNLDYSLENFNFVSQFTSAGDGELDRYAWFVQPSYLVKLPFGWKYLNDHRILVRYGRLDVDNTPAFARTAAWDREELTFALISNITKNFLFKSEYSFDWEDTGGRDVDNDELQLRLEYEF